MNKYYKVDAEILNMLSNGKNLFMQFSTNKMISLCHDSGLTGETFRIIDRRLQALRKAGKIKFSHSEGWSLVSPK